MCNAACLSHDCIKISIRHIIKRQTIHPDVGKMKEAKLEGTLDWIEPDILTNIGKNNKPHNRRPCQRPRQRWRDNFQQQLKINTTGLAQNSCSFYFQLYPKSNRERNGKEAYKIHLQRDSLID